MNSNRLSVQLLTFMLFFSGQLAAESMDAVSVARELDRTRTDPDSSVTVLIAAPMDFVFEFLATRPQDYTADAIDVAFDHSNSDRPGVLGEGSLRTIVLENGETLVQRFLLVDPPASYAYFTDMAQSTVSVPLAYSLARYSLFEEPEGTRLQVDVVYQSSSRLLAFFVKRAFAAALKRDFAAAASTISERYTASGTGDSTL